jgi:hypothetical protein
MTDGSKRRSVTNQGSALQRSFDAAAAGERNDGQIDEGAQRASEVAPTVCRLATHREVGNEESGESQQYRRPGREQQGEIDPTEPEQPNDARYQQQPDESAGELLRKVLFRRALQHRQVVAHGV